MGTSRGCEVMVQVVQDGGCPARMLQSMWGDSIVHEIYIPWNYSKESFPFPFGIIPGT